jgi:Acyl-CoA dehydrogenase, C-terminal domain
VISQHAVLQADLGRAEGLLRSGRALLYQTLDEVWQVAAAGETLSIMQRAALLLPATQAAQAAIQTVDLMFSAGDRPRSMPVAGWRGACVTSARRASTPPWYQPTTKCLARRRWDSMSAQIRCYGSMTAAREDKFRTPAVGRLRTK